jgi:Zn-dependent peptidase ImmA (M78 family)
MDIKIKKHNWKIIDVPDKKMRKDWGECDYGNRKIKINKEAKSKRRLNTIVHELAHAIFPKMSHKNIYELANVISKVLLKDKWQRKN